MYSRKAIVASLEVMFEGWIQANQEAPPWDCYVPPELAARMAEAAATVLYVLEDAERDHTNERREFGERPSVSVSNA